jgi:hypothetical protein
MYVNESLRVKAKERGKILLQTVSFYLIAELLRALSRIMIIEKDTI